MRGEWQYVLYTYPGRPGGILSSWTGLWRWNGSGFGWRLLMAKIRLRWGKVEDTVFSNLQFISVWIHTVSLVLVTTWQPSKWYISHQLCAISGTNLYIHHGISKIQIRGNLMIGWGGHSAALWIWFYLGAMLMFMWEFEKQVCYSNKNLLFDPRQWKVTSSFKKNGPTVVKMKLYKASQMTAKICFM